MFVKFSKRNDTPSRKFNPNKQSETRTVQTQYRPKRTGSSHLNIQMYKVLVMQMFHSFENLPEQENHFPFASTRSRFVGIVSYTMPM